MDENEDSFADNESLLDGIPKKVNKKKKKTTIPNIFDDGQGILLYIKTFVKRSSCWDCNSAT